MVADLLHENLRASCLSPAKMQESNTGRERKGRDLPSHRGDRASHNLERQVIAWNYRREYSLWVFSIAEVFSIVTVLYSCSITEKTENDLLTWRR